MRDMDDAGEEGQYPGFRPASRSGLAFFTIISPVVVIAITVYASIRAARAAVGAAWPVLSERRLEVGPSRISTPEEPSGESGPDPAFPGYLFGPIRRDWRITYSIVTKRIQSEIKEIRDQAYGQLIAKRPTYTFAPLWCGYFSGVYLAYMVAMAGFVVVAALQLVLLIVTSVIFAILAVAVITFERIEYHRNNIRLSCPYGPCGKAIDLPEYICPGCMLVHRHLVPGRTGRFRLLPGEAGVFRHVCRCGTSLPTALVLGRYRLAAQCPHCETRLPGRVGRVTVTELPFVGGTAAGKSTLLNLMVAGIRKHVRETGGRLDFVAPEDKDRFQIGRIEFRQGQQLAKTIGQETRAVILDLVPVESRGRIAYFFDLSGEVTATTTTLRRQPYLAYAQALAVVVDPLSIPGVRAGLTEDEKMQIVSLDKSFNEQSRNIDPSTIIGRVARIRAEPTQKFARIAVIVTKKDLMAKTGIGAALARKPETVESWLGALGLDKDLKLLSQRTQELRYLASGFDDDGSDLLTLVRWIIGLDRRSWFPWRRALRRRAAAPVRHSWPARDPEEKIPYSYRLGRTGVLGGYVLAAIIGPAALMAGLAYAFSFLF